MKDIYWLDHRKEHVYLQEFIQNFLQFVAVSLQNILKSLHFANFYAKIFRGIVEWKKVSHFFLRNHLVIADGCKFKFLL